MRRHAPPCSGTSSGTASSSRGVTGSGSTARWRTRSSPAARPLATSHDLHRDSRLQRGAHRPGRRRRAVPQARRSALGVRADPGGERIARRNLAAPGKVAGDADAGVLGARAEAELRPGAGAGNPGGGRRSGDLRRDRSLRRGLLPARPAPSRAGRRLGGGLEGDEGRERLETMGPPRRHPGHQPPAAHRDRVPRHGYARAESVQAGAAHGRRPRLRGRAGPVCERVRDPGAEHGTRRAGDPHRNAREAASVYRTPAPGATRTQWAVHAVVDNTYPESVVFITYTTFSTTVL